MAASTGVAGIRRQAKDIITGVAAVIAEPVVKPSIGLGKRLAGFITTAICSTLGTVFPGPFLGATCATVLAISSRRVCYLISRLRPWCTVVLDTVCVGKLATRVMGIRIGKITGIGFRLTVLSLA